MIILPRMISVVEENEKMIEMPITLEPYESYCNRLIEETHKMVKEMHGIVHCKDCKYWEEESSGRTYCERTIFWTNMDADDFCSRGERAE